MAQQRTSPTYREERFLLSFREQMRGIHKLYLDISHPLCSYYWGGALSIFSKFDFFFRLEEPYHLAYNAV
jgi:hypothetical protein